MPQHGPADRWPRTGPAGKPAHTSQADTAAPPEPRLHGTGETARLGQSKSSRPRPIVRRANRGTARPLLHRRQPAQTSAASQPRSSPATASRPRPSGRHPARRSMWTGRACPRILRQPWQLPRQKIQDLWNQITPMARWEWVRWVNATKNPDTRRRRADVMSGSSKRGQLSLERHHCWEESGRSPSAGPCTAQNARICRWSRTASMPGSGWDSTGGVPGPVAEGRARGCLGGVDAAGRSWFC